MASGTNIVSKRDLLPRVPQGASPRYYADRILRGLLTALDSEMYYPDVLPSTSLEVAANLRAWRHTVPGGRSLSPGKILPLAGRCERDLIRSAMLHTLWGDFACTREIPDMAAENLMEAECRLSELWKRIQ